MQASIHINAMPYVPGAACGPLQRGPGGVTPGSILLLDANDIGSLKSPPAGLIVVDGAPLSHNMIRLLGYGVPTVILSAAQANPLRPGMMLALDGVSGLVTSEVDAVPARAPVPSVTAGQSLTTVDGVAVNLRASVRNAAAARQAVAAGAQAIGLVRSEFFLPQAGGVPTYDYYRLAFGELCEAAAPLSVTIRLLDLAADKIPAWMPAGAAVSGVLGLQGVRLFGIEPARQVFHAQLAALDELGRRFDVRLLIPYLVRFEELCYWSETIRARLSQPLPFGAMIETPAGALDIANWFRVADFISIGCNDLMQCLFAADRDRAELAAYLDPYAPPLFRFMQQVAHAAGEQLTQVQLCGLLPQLQGVLPVLLGLGYRNFSVDAALVPFLAQTVQASSIVELESMAADVCAATTSRQVTESLGLQAIARLPFLVP